MKRWVILGSAALCALAQFAWADPVPTPACEMWIESLEPYSKTMYEVIGREEMHDSYERLEKASAAYFPGGPTDELDTLESANRERSARLSEIEPPVELQTLHAMLGSYYAALAISAARIRDGGLEAKPYALRSALTEVIACYERMLEDFVENGCETGDTEALRERLLPELRSWLGLLEKEIQSQ